MRAKYKSEMSSEGAGNRSSERAKDEVEVGRRETRSMGVQSKNGHEVVTRAAVASTNQRPKEAR